MLYTNYLKKKKTIYLPIFFNINSYLINNALNGPCKLDLSFNSEVQSFLFYINYY